MKTLTLAASTRWAGRPVYFYENIDSTNLQAKRLSDMGAPHGALVVAEMQTAGRGRRGRSWVSLPGINIYYTILLKPEFSPDKSSMLTLVMGYSAARAIRVETGLNAGIKWPNDIVVNGKKLCGILTELSVEKDRIQNVVIGVGINVHEQEFSSYLADKATFLDRECGFRVNRNRLLSVIMEFFEEDYERFVSAGNLLPFKDAYERMLVNRDREVCVEDTAGAYEGIARGITETGELIVELADKSRREVFAGEVSVRGIYGYV